MGILSEEQRALIERDGEEGYLYRLLQRMEDWVRERKFSRYALDHDLEAALWRAYAYINIDSHEAYQEAERCLKLVEDQGSKSGVWCYRYSAALTYLGRYDEALRYALQGAREEPGYPWAWLHLARLSYRAGEAEQALHAVERGLELVPGDYEFLTTKREIEEGADFSQMLGHYIDPEADRQAGPRDPLAQVRAQKERRANKGKKTKFE